MLSGMSAASSERPAASCLRASRWIWPHSRWVVASQPGGAAGLRANASGPASRSQTFLAAGTGALLWAALATEASPARRTGAGLAGFGAPILHRLGLP
jgi:hypothetical protein